MALNLVAAAFANRGDQAVHLFVLPAEILHLAAALANQKVLVPGKSRHERLAAGRLVDSLDQAKLFQLFNSTVHSDQAQLRITSARQLEYIIWA